MADRKCPDCDIEMELGFIRDLSPGGGNQSSWHKGEAEAYRVLGMKKGVKIDQRALVPVTAYRCTNCGLLRHYAKNSSNE